MERDSSAFDIQTLTTPGEDLRPPFSTYVVKSPGKTIVIDPGPAQPPSEYSGIAGIAFTFVPGLSLKYHFEYLGRQALEDGIRNILVLDARF